MKEVVWIFGTSAAGKHTFIKQVLADEDLQARLGWGNKVIAPCQESIDLLGHVGDKQIVSARKSIAGSCTKLLNNADVVLIKWQYVDTHNSTPQKLKELFPSAKHRIILLKTESQEIKERLATKTWWKEFWNDTSFSDNEREMVAKCIKQLSSDFEIITLDSSKDRDYPLID